MIAEKKLTKALLNKVNKLGWSLEEPTYQGVCRYAFDKRCDYFMIFPLKPKQWYVWLIWNFEKPNLQDGKLNQIELVDDARSYEQALCKGVARYVDSLYKAYQSTCKMTERPAPHLRKGYGI